jgi:hypothetical protein
MTAASPATAELFKAVLTEERPNLLFSIDVTFFSSSDWMAGRRPQAVDDKDIGAHTLLTRVCDMKIW